MGVFDTLKQAELQQACKDRELPAGGTNAEMVARLEEYEASLLDDEGEASVDPVVANLLPPGSVTTSGTEGVQMDKLYMPEPPEQPRSYVVTFPAPGGVLPTDVHEQNRLNAYQQAITAGHVPRGGLAGVYRSGWTAIDGVQHAVYTVALRRSRSPRRGRQ